jgi:membrane-associated phospholipid phosphatase
MDLTRQPGTPLRLFSLHRLALVVVCLAVLPDRPVVAASVAGAQVAAACLLHRASLAPPAARGYRWRLFLPYVLWVICWLEVGWLRGLASPTVHDAGIVAIDRAVFGAHWHDRLGELWPGAGVAEAMQAIYLSYYALVLGPPLVLALRGRHGDCARYTGAVMATYLVCFLVYTVHPVLGPRIMAATTPGAGPDSGLVAGFAEGLRRAGDVPGTAFPSSHCAGALAAALAAGEFLSRRRRIALLVWAALISISTVHTGNHYALDAAAGLLLAVVVRFALARSSAVQRPRTREVLS